jgi:hypothetical protein
MPTTVARHCVSLVYMNSFTNRPSRQGDPAQRRLPRAVPTLAALSYPPVLSKDVPSSSGQNAAPTRENTMEEPNVSIAVSVKIVDEHHFEFTTPYGSAPSNGDEFEPSHVQVAESTSSVLAPGAHLPVA